MLLTIVVVKRDVQREIIKDLLSSRRKILCIGKLYNNNENIVRMPVKTSIAYL